MDFESREVWKLDFNGKSDIYKGGEFPVGVAEDLNGRQPQNVEGRHFNEANYTI